MWMVPRRVARFGSRRTPAWAYGSSQGAILQQQPWGGGGQSSASSSMAPQVESGVLKASMPCPRGHFSPSATDHCARELRTAGPEGLELF